MAVYGCKPKDFVDSYISSGKSPIQFHFAFDYIEDVPLTRSVMDPFTPLQGSQKFPPGREWAVLKKLPHVFLLGTALLLGMVVFAEAGFFGFTAKEVMLFQYAALGGLLLHWMSILGVGLFCGIIWIMKGPAYVRDPYYLPDSDVTGK